MPPPPASTVTSRLFLGPALRAQPDRRLVKLVRNGYENAFEEIVRRYGKALGRYAAAIVSPSRAEDVTQDAFAKALLSLRGTDKEIELRPWLYRIVRNTALNDIRDQPPPTAELPAEIGGAESPAETAERRAEIADLLARLRALPEPQRAAIVMRELEGLSHEEIAASLGMSGGAARQAIYRGRQALRNGVGMLVPLPLLQSLLSESGATVGTAAVGTGAAAGSGVALKAGLATVLVAGSVGAGVAVHESRHKGGGRADAASSLPAAANLSTTEEIADSSATGAAGGGQGEAQPGDNQGGRHHGRRGNDNGSGGGHSGHGSGKSGSGSGSSGSGSGSSGSGSGSSGSSGDDSGSSSSGSGSSGSGSGSSGSSGDDSGSSSGGSEFSGDSFSSASSGSGGGDGSDDGGGSGFPGNILPGD